MIIPNKSTIEEEYIEVPYGRDGRESGSTTVDERERSRETSGDAGRLTDGEMDSASEYPSPLSPRSPPAGLSGLSARLKGVDDDEGVVSGAGGRSGDDYFDKYGRSSVNSDRSIGNGMAARVAGRASVSEDQEKIRRDYEYKIATMQTQITNLQRDLGDVGEKERRWREGEAKVRQMEEELVGLRRVSNFVRINALLGSYVPCGTCSVLKNKVQPCEHFRENLMNYVKFVKGRTSKRLFEHRKMKANYGCCASVATFLKTRSRTSKQRFVGYLCSLFETHVVVDGPRNA
jgi:hypothetical protein